VTISDLHSSASIPQKSTEASSSRQDKDAEASSTKKVKGRKGKDPVADLDAEGPESGDDTHGSPRVHLTERKRGLASDSDSEPESEANFRYGARKKGETVILRDARINLGDDFFDDV